MLLKGAVIHGKIVRIYFNKEFHYDYTVLQDCRVGARPAPTIRESDFRKLLGKLFHNSAPL